jgi:hypothetical protein
LCTWGLGISMVTNTRMRARARARTHTHTHTHTHTNAHTATPGCSTPLAGGYYNVLALIQIHESSLIYSQLSTGPAMH